MCKWMLWINIFNLLAFASRIIVDSRSCIFSSIENLTKEETAKFPCRFFDKVLKICRIQKAISRRNMNRIRFQRHLWKACFFSFILFIVFFKNSIERHETHDRGFLFFNCKALLNLDSSGCVSPPLTVQTWVDFIWIVWLVNRNIKKDFASVYLIAVFSTKITIIVMLIRRKFRTWYDAPSREPFFSNNFWVLKCGFIHR